MIRALDARLIAAHQRVVDAAQRPPAWLARQATFLAAVLAVIRVILTQESMTASNYVSFLVLGLLCGVTYVPSIFGSLKRLILLRVMSLSLNALHVPILVASVALSYLALPTALLTLNSLCLTAFYYFAACEGPKPPERRLRLIRKEAVWQ